MLQWHQDQYKLVVSLKPGHLVRRLSVEITVSERMGIGYVHIPHLRTSCLHSNRHTGEADSSSSTKIEKGETCVQITFCPTLQDQTAFSSSSIMADFVVQYDVVMEDIIGDVRIYGGYFIHYFAPRGLPSVEKNVVFIIDVRGSMFGTKMMQTKKAMNVILGDQQANDYFNIISFCDTVSVWKAEGSIQATIQNVHSAKDYQGHMEVDGEELQLLSESIVESKFMESLNPPAFYTFLTPDEDGNPHWDGNSEEILQGPGGHMQSQGSSAWLAKGILPSIFTFSSSVDGEPHFVIHIPLSEERIFFTLDGSPGDLLQLIDDPEAGLHVQGQLIGAPPRPGYKDQTHTYFQIITVTTDKSQAYTVTITQNSISVQGQFQHTNIRLVTGPEGPSLQRHQGPDMAVVLGKRLLKYSPRLQPHWASCWLVKRSHRLPGLLTQRTQCRLFQKYLGQRIADKKFEECPTLLKFLA
ncbi:Inter-alpha-trypsin inhibitor heavy chain H6 [Manis javanica]|nr:Inter-alpha-trypsin inhibitor heavy chain H6 [Manis javanica]